MKLLIFFLLIFNFNIYSQKIDTSITISKSKLNKINSPKRAALLSVLLPGAGQIYNKKYWKAPIVWAGLGACTYVYFSTNVDYQNAKNSYISLIDSDPNNNIDFNGSYDLNKISFQKNQLRNNRDLMLVLGILFYGLNILDATIDAHLMSFDVSDDLALKINPSIHNSLLYTPTLDFTLSLKPINKKNNINFKL